MNPLDVHGRLVHIPACKSKPCCRDIPKARLQSFTLIELLVVMSIISLLVAILLPALGGVRQAGRNVVCQSTLRQLGLSFYLYTSDYKDSFPQLSLPSPWDANLSKLNYTTRANDVTDWGYTAHPPVHVQCPEDPMGGHPVGVRFQSSYGALWNGVLSHRNRDPWPGEADANLDRRLPAHLNMVPSPDRTLVVGDSYRSETEQHSGIPKIRMDVNNVGIFAGRHNGRTTANVLMVSGAVAAYRATLPSRIAEPMEQSVNDLNAWRYQSGWGDFRRLTAPGYSHAGLSGRLGYLDWSVGDQ